MWIVSETRTWHDNKLQSNATYRLVLRTQLNCLTSLAKWLSVCLRTKWLWVRIPLLSRDLQIWHLLQTRSSLIFRQTIEWGFCLKLASDMIITYSQTHRRGKYSQHSWIIWPVGLNYRVFVDELSFCGFESRCYHLNFRQSACFMTGVPWHPGKLESVDSLWNLIMIWYSHQCTV